jgi:hypothetical protein
MARTALGPAFTHPSLGIYIADRNHGLDPIFPGQTDFVCVPGRLEGSALAPGISLPSNTELNGIERAHGSGPGRCL